MATLTEVLTVGASWIVFVFKYLYQKIEIESKSPSECVLRRQERGRTKRIKYEPKSVKYRRTLVIFFLFHFDLYSNITKASIKTSTSQEVSLFTNILC